MTVDRALRAMFALTTLVLVMAALHLAESIFAPVAFALFIIAIVWPLQRRLQTVIPGLLAMAVTIVLTLVVIVVIGWLMIWGFSRVAQWLMANAGRFQALYLEGAQWLEGHGIYAVGLVTERFDVMWLVRAMQGLAGRIQTLVAFSMLTFVFVVLGLLEVDVIRSNVARLGNRAISAALLTAGSDIAAKLRRYMLVRTVMSVMTGLFIWAFAAGAGLELASAWGVIAFTLNYVPFLGPLVATVLPALFAILQFESWQMALLILVGMNAIQFLGGSYLEPRIAGKALSLSPFMVLFAVFFWAFIWGIPGAFIGVPIMIAAITLCGENPNTRWIQELLSGPAAEKA